MLLSLIVVCTLAVIVARQNGNSSLQPNYNTKIPWSSPILMVELQDLDKMLGKAPPIFLSESYEKTDVEETFQSSVNRFLIKLRSCTESLDSLEKWKHNFSKALGGVQRQENHSIQDDLSSDFSFILAIRPIFTSLADFEKVIKSLADLNKDGTIAQIFLDFGGVRLGQLNAFHIIQYTKLCNQVGKIVKFTCGLLFESRICGTSLLQTLSQHLHEIENSYVYLETSHCTEDNWNYDYYSNCVDEFGIRPAYILCMDPLRVSNSSVVVDDAISRANHSVVSSYYTISTLLHDDATNDLEPYLYTTYPPKYPADYILSIESLEFLELLQNGNQQINFTTFETVATIMDVYRRYLVRFQLIHSDKVGLNVVLTALKNYKREFPNEYFQHPLSLWISFCPSGDLMPELLQILEQLTITNKSILGLISHVVIDYGLLRVDSVTYSLVEKDVNICNQVLSGKPLSCGFLFHRRNCMRQLNVDWGYITNLPFDEGNLVILNGMSPICASILRWTTVRSALHGAVSIDFDEKISKETQLPVWAIISLQGGKMGKGRNRVEKDVFIYTATVSSSNITAEKNILVYPFEKAWLQSKFEFEPYIGFTATHVEIKHFPKLPINIVLRLPQGSLRTCGENIQEMTEYLHNQELQCNWKICNSVSVTFSLGTILQDDLRCLNDLFSSIALCPIKSQRIVYSVLIDWSPWKIKFTSNSTVSREELVDRFDYFLILAEYAQMMSNSSGVRLEFYVDRSFLVAHQNYFIIHRDSEGSGLPKWQSAFRNYHFLIVRVGTNLENLSKIGAYKITKVLIDEMEDYVQLTQAMLFTVTDLDTYLHQQIGFEIAVYGCNNSLSWTESAELARFWEIVNNWAKFMKGTAIIIDTAFDNTISSCSSPKHSLLLAEHCACGWWTYDEQNTRMFTMKENAEFLYNKWERMNSKTQATEKSSFLTKLIPISFILTVVFVGCSLLVVCSSQRYKRKMLVTETEMSVILNGNRVDPGSSTHIVYDKNKLEIKRGNLAFDKNKPIARGESGTTILKGTIKTSSGHQDVAIKHFKCDHDKQLDNMDMCALMALVMEAKIISFMGNHVNIVKIFGACTANLRRGEVFLALEYCVFSSLDKILRRQQRYIENNTDENQFDTSGEEFSSLVSKWSWEIANAMDFISSKQIVHCDLAARNVLIGITKSAKVCDFGLSRRLEAGKSYEKQSMEPLPWRWMAPESLVRSTFNEKSDVWAFGITLWEMQTFGEVPYGGTSWSGQFLSMLQDGLRPEIPEITVAGVREIIKRCWNIEPAARPSFSQCKALLETGDC